MFGAILPENLNKQKKICRNTHQNQEKVSPNGPQGLRMMIVVILDDGAGAHPPNQAPPPLVVSRIYSHARAHEKKRSSSRPPAGTASDRKSTFFAPFLLKIFVKIALGWFSKRAPLNPPLALLSAGKAPLLWSSRAARVTKVVCCRPKVMILED